MKEVAPGRGSVWRPMTEHERKELGPRCSVTGLMRGDCDQQRFGTSPYCYYHTKVSTGLITTCHDRRLSEIPYVDDDGVLRSQVIVHWVEIPWRERYPVYPLPASGYVLLAAPPQAVAA